MYIFKNYQTKNYDNSCIYSYCGNCSSDNFLSDSNGYLILDENEKCECLDCGWKGTKYETKIMKKL